jgi:hypothetical protein
LTAISFILNPIFGYRCEQFALHAVSPSYGES